MEKKFKKKKTFSRKMLSMIVAIAVIVSVSIPVLADDTTTVYDSTSTTETLSWKAFDSLLGYSVDNDTYEVTESGDGTSVGVYEFREGGTSDGDLIYSWTFDGSDFTTPIYSYNKGPINLTVTTDYSEESGLDVDFDFYSPHDTSYGTSLSGDATLKLYVGDYYAVGQDLMVTGPDDYYDTVTVDSDGYISMPVCEGGSYNVSNTIIYDSTSTTAKLSWKQFNVLYNNDQTGIYEFREGGTSDGNLDYSWTFDGTDFSSAIASDDKGPINLTLSTDYSEDTGLEFSFDLYSAEATDVDELSGYATLKLDVSDYFEDGETIVILGLDGYYYNEVTVTDGYISLNVDQGGTYTAVTYESVYYPEYNDTCTSGDCTFTITAAEGVIYEDDTVTIEEVESGDDYDNAVTSLEDAVSEFILYNISLINSDYIEDEDGVNGEVTITISVPDGYSNPVIYYIDDEGNAELLESTVEDGYITFTTTHFSNYAIADSIVSGDSSDSDSYASIDTSTDTSTNTSTESAQTGDDSQPGLMLLLIAAAGGTIVYLRKKSELKYNQ